MKLLKDQNDLLRLNSFFSPSDPSAWSRSDLDRWIRWTMNQYNIPDPSGAVAQQWATTAAGEEMDGQRFLQLSEQDFRDRMPQVSCEVARPFNSRNLNTNALIAPLPFCNCKSAPKEKRDDLQINEIEIKR